MTALLFSGETSPNFLMFQQISGQNRKYQRLYDRTAPFYTISTSIFALFKSGGDTKRRLEYLQELEARTGDKVLEVSVGAGGNWRILPRTARYFGLDISRGMLNECQKHIKKWKLEADLFQGEAEHLPFKDAVFDVVYHVGGINFFNDKSAAIREMIRVSKSGTKLLIVDETERVARKFEKVPFSDGFYSKRPETITTPVDMVPQNMLEINVREVAKGDLYCLTFRKP